jgi:hypothetical protein
LESFFSKTVSKHGAKIGLCGGFHVVWTVNSRVTEYIFVKHLTGICCCSEPFTVRMKNVVTQNFVIQNGCNSRPDRQKQREIFVID